MPSCACIFQGYSVQKNISNRGCTSVSYFCFFLYYSQPLSLALRRTVMSAVCFSPLEAVTV